MAEANSPTLDRLDRFFPITMVVGLILVVSLFSFSEQDRRGLLLWDRPDALAAGADTQSPGSYEIAYLGYNRASSGLHGRTARPGDGPRRNAGPVRGQATDAEPTGARRIIPGRRGVDPFGSSEPLVQNSSPLAGVGAARSIAQSGGNGAPGLTPFTPGNLGGSGPTPPGVIAPVDSGAAPPATGGETPPVVPAVPEPAAWLLMILGVGLLAGALRAQVRRQAAPVA